MKKIVNTNQWARKTIFRIGNKLVKGNTILSPKDKNHQVLTVSHHLPSLSIIVLASECQGILISARHALIDLVNEIYSAIDKSLPNLCVLLYLVKAFDAVSHQKIIESIEKYYASGDRFP